MNNQDIRYSESFKVRTHEVDSRMKMTIPSFLKIMQEASMQNAIDLKFSIWDMEEEKASWVLVRKSFFVQRFPEYGERVKVVTYPSGFEKIFAYRDFKAYDESDKMIAWASSTWTLLNLETRRVVSLPTDFDKLILPEDENILDRAESRILSVNEPSTSSTYLIGRYDLDWNDHVNNMVYVRRMLELSPSDFIEEKCFRQLNYQIKSECHLGENIEISIERKSDTVLSYQINSADSNKVIALANSYWDTK